MANETRHLVESRCQEDSRKAYLRQRVETVAGELSTSKTAVCEQEAIITQLQRSYSQQRCDLRAQLGLSPDDDDDADVRHAKKVQELQRQISAAEAVMQSSAPDLEQCDARVAAAKQARDALGTETLDIVNAIKMGERQQERLHIELPNIRAQCAQQEDQLRTQQKKLAELESAAIRAQEKSDAAKAAAAANKAAGCSPTGDAEALLEMLRTRLAGTSTPMRYHRKCDCMPRCGDLFAGSLVGQLGGTTLLTFSRRQSVRLSVSHSPPALVLVLSPARLLLSHQDCPL